MLRFTTGSRLGAILFGLLLVSCGGANKTEKPASSPVSNTSAENSNAAKTNVEELSLLVNVPYESEDIVWKEDTAHKKLIAVLRFSTEDANKLAGDAAGRRAPENVTLTSASWFPAELIAQSEMSGDDSLHGISYAADVFYQDPYSSGRIVRIEGTDYFVLELSSK
jgi:hypothetical protein